MSGYESRKAAARIGQQQLFKPQPVKRQPRTVWCSPEDRAIFADETFGDDIMNYLGDDETARKRRVQRLLESLPRG